MTGKRLALGLVALAFASAASAQSIRQTAEAVDLATGDAVRGGGVLTREENEVWARISTMDLESEAAYSVWWVVFNDPGNCLMPYECSDADILADEVLNETQIQAARISVFYADGFVTGTDGVAYVIARLDAGELPEDTFVVFGWGEDFGPPNGLVEDNGLGAEIHLVVRTHGPAVAGSVGAQTSTFDALCDEQDCADQQAVEFRSPEAPPEAP